MELGIIGAGMAGLTAAHWLHENCPDITITVYEKSRGVGGRAATRRLHNAVFDHGAQYIKAPSGELAALLQEKLPHDSLVDIALPVWTFDRDNAIQAGDPAQNRDPKWTYRDGITRLAKELARNLQVRAETRVHHIVQANPAFAMLDDQNTVIATMDAVLLTPPAPQSYTLIANSPLPEAARKVLLHELARATYRPCLTFTLGYAPVLRDRPFYALVNSDKQHPISWLAYEHLKPGRNMNGQHVLIAQMAPQWSSDHWNDAPDAAAAHVAGLISDLLDEDARAPQWFDRQGWRYALPDSGCDFQLLNQALPGLFFAGDFTAGQGRVHRAIEEGWRVAEYMAQYAAH